MAGSSRQRAALVLIAIVALQPAPDLAQGNDPASEVIVTFSARRFDPARVEVRRGVRVTFHNLSSTEVLTIVSASGAFESWPLGRHGQWSHVFTEAGRHEFHVKEHPEVRGFAEVR